MTVDGVGGDLDEIVARLLEAVPHEGRRLVAIDGVGGSGKSTFAAHLAERIDTRPVLVVHADDPVRSGEAGRSGAPRKSSRVARAPRSRVPHEIVGAEPRSRAEPSISVP